MSEMQELARMINSTVEATLVKIQKKVDDLQVVYIKRNYSLSEENTRLRSEIMYYEKEKERYDAGQKLIKKLRKIIYWTFGSIGAVIILLLLMIIWGWI